MEIKPRYQIGQMVSTHKTDFDTRKTEVRKGKIVEIIASITEEFITFEYRIEGIKGKIIEGVIF